MAESSSVVATKTNFRLYKGDTFTRTITVTDGAKAPFNFSGASLTFTVKDTPGAASNVAQLTIGSGITVASNVITITMSAATTAALSLKRYVYDLKFTSSGGAITTWMLGGFSVEQDVS